MDLQNNRIAVGKLLSNPRARAIAQREFPQLMANPFLLGMARNMTLQQALCYAGNLPKQQIDRILSELERA